MKSESPSNHQPPLLLSPAPHLRGRTSIERDMYIVTGALLLPVAGAVYFFGLYVLLMLGTALISAVFSEYICKMMRRRVFHMDGSAVVTAILFTLTLPPRTPLWIVVIGAIFAIAIGKEVFGGLGQNIFNPALAGRAVVGVSFPVHFTEYIAPTTSWLGDGVTTATPLAVGVTPHWDLFIGNVAGSVGETSALLILISGIILIATGLIKWQVPLFFIGTVAGFSFILGQNPLFHILAGGLMLGAFFMVTDYVTTPLTTNGRIIFVLGAGILVVLIRLFAHMPEGVAFSILLMNAVTPLIDRYIRPRPYGYRGRKIGVIR
ncbi:RnfABCDGE type electron transport complex subunit D [Candidatus Acetothermia bacterium]|nr:RnfABCDGE type electron transport complex subunit D [Candidatus Acetothermia bacterium]MCI2427651.1 RnfABCDGE type electron transport complex subunit D [Candidatus Acetothermia bacterium]MCI2428832.1 RnfABCDGE type electron transport complex subunit D [Candidatus Acetothermia bacterium]